MTKDLSHVNVLIVEDETALNQAYTTILKSRNIKVESSYNGLEALEKVADHRPDVILLDLRMPKMNGLEFLKEFSKTKQASQTKVIIFSNYDEQKEIDEAFSLGANRYMLKSWTSPSELIKLIESSL
ncbi:MAG: response regulator [Candidatus Saccharimonadales bacterium]